MHVPKNCLGETERVEDTNGGGAIPETLGSMRWGNTSPNHYNSLLFSLTAGNNCCREFLVFSSSLIRRQQWQNDERMKGHSLNPVYSCKSSGLKFPENVHNNYEYSRRCVL